MERHKAIGGERQVQGLQEQAFRVRREGSGSDPGKAAVLRASSMRGRDERLVRSRSSGVELVTSAFWSLQLIPLEQFVLLGLAFGVGIWRTGLESCITCFCASVLKRVRGYKLAGSVDTKIKVTRLNRYSWVRFGSEELISTNVLRMYRPLNPSLSFHPPFCMTVRSSILTTVSQLSAAQVS